MNIDKMTRLTTKMKSQTVTQEERESAISKAHDYIILGYTLINAADIIMRRTVDVMQSIGDRVSYKDSFDLKNVKRDIERAIRRIDMNSGQMDENIHDITPLGYDRLRENSYEILRFVMLLYSRTAGDGKATMQLNEYMAQMKSNGMFGDKEIGDIKMK